MTIEFRQATQELFGFLKNTSDLKSAWINSIEVKKNLFLLPVTYSAIHDENLITILTQWRNQFRSAYPTQFTATSQSTRNWLENILLPSKNRILFLLIDGGSNVAGHIGLSADFETNLNVLEIDNVVKSPDVATRNLMSSSVQKLISWVMPILPVDEIYLKVMEDNNHAIRFYSNLGFIMSQRLKLRCERKIEDPDFLNFKIDPDGNDGAMLLMKYRFPKIDSDQMILTAGPSISQMEGYFAYDAAMNGWNSNWSKYLTQFEQEFATYVGANFAIATSSCTGALQIALLASGIGEGDEVIVPDETWVASATAVRDVGAIPIFCDVDLSTYNMNLEDCISKISSKTRAIIPVHMYGNPANITELQRVATEYGLAMIEDAAPAIGAKFSGKCVGTFGQFGCFSFQGAKMLVTGEGGMLVTNDHGLYEKAKKIADQGRNPNKTFWIDAKGVKYKMSNVQAAIGLAQIRRSDLQISMKRRINAWYKEYLEDLDCIEFQAEYEGAQSIHWMTSIRLLENAPITRDDLIAELRSNNIDTRPLFPAISQYPIWSVPQQPNYNAHFLGNSAMNLPSGVGLSRGKVEYICSKIRNILRVEVKN